MSLAELLHVRTSEPGAGIRSAPQLVEMFESNNLSYLKKTLQHIAIPRHYEAENSSNKLVASFIENEFQQFGLQTFRQGKYDNIVASTLENPAAAQILIGAHYDSVPNCPGADDNGSAVAGMLAAAKVLTSVAPLPIMYVAFNREEDGFLGSLDFVNNYLSPRNPKLKAAHILEMIGYSDTTPGSQSIPAGLPIKLRDTGDFIGIVMNDTSNHFAEPLINMAEKYASNLPMTTLEVFDGMENHVAHLLRSDHSPFWDAGLPALMWTDTSEFRNPHYHQASDTPEILDYEFLKGVTDLLVLHCLIELKQAPY